MKIKNFIDHRFFDLIQMTGDDEMRLNIAGVHVDLKRKVAEVTDGHAYVRIPLYIEDNLTGKYLLPKEFIESIKGFKLQNWSLDKAELELDDKKATFIFQSLRFTQSINFGEFPDVEKLIFSEVKSKKKATFCFNPDLLIRCKRAISQPEKGLRLDFYGEAEPIIIKDASDKIVGAIMPMKL